MAGKIVIRDGRVTGVYSDILMPLYKALGTPVITRASNVEHNPESQEWEARLCSNPGALISHGPTRADVIKQEVNYLEERL